MIFLAGQMIFLTVQIFLNRNKAYCVRGANLCPSHKKPAPRLAIFCNATINGQAIARLDVGI